MAAPPPSSRLQNMLQAAVQSINWTYSLFWQICPQQGVLVWADGYYNGAIKTRKTVEPVEVSAEEASLQRSQQLRDLYDSLSIGETNQPARRPYAALSPEDLTESEWFYLMCVSFSFAPGAGLPGKAYARRQHAWLVGANEVDSKTFTRAILAKSAHIQTVVCIPLLDGVVEVGITERVEEDLALIQHIKTFFTNHPNPLPPKPALSEHSTSNPATSLNHPPFFHSSNSPTPNSIYTTAEPQSNQLLANEEDEEEEEDEESDSEAETARDVLSRQNEQPAGVNMAERSELIMQLEMSEDIRFGSPEDGSNNLDSDFQRADSLRAESTRRWPISQDPLPITSNILQQLPPGPLQPLEELSQEDTHYSVTVSAILNNHPTRLPVSSRSSHLDYSTQSAFAKWTNQIQNTPRESTSQWLLKYILFSVPFLHKKYNDEISPKSSDAFRLRKSASQDELSANHVLAERRRREKLNEKFIILRSLVPFVTKMDKASILGDTIEYLKQLREKIQDLETRKTENEQRSRSAGTNINNSGLTSEMGRAMPCSDRRKLRIVEGSGGSAKSKTVDSSPEEVVEMVVEVSIIESDALLELQCGYREGLLLDIMEKLRELGIEVTTVQSSLNNNGSLLAELRAKVGKKTSIMEVKRAIKQIILITRDSEL